MTCLCGRLRGGSVSEISAGYCMVSVLDEPARAAKCGVHAPVAQSHARDQSSGGMSEHYQPLIRQ